jgi:hypothetical protein
MNRLNQIARRLIPAAAAAGITMVLFSAVVSIGEPQRSQIIATNMLDRQAGIVAKARQPERAAAMAANESPKSAAVLAIALADDHRDAGR